MGDTYVSVREPFDVEANPRPKSKRTLWIVAGLVAFGLVFGVIWGATRSSDDETTSFRDAMQVDNIMVHLRALDGISQRPGFDNSRSVVNGYNASAEYVLETLRERAPGLNVYTQSFIAPVQKQLSPPVMSLVDADNNTVYTFIDTQDFRGMRYGQNGQFDMTHPLVWIEDGCDPAQWEQVTGDVVALTPWGSSPCDSYDKATFAQNTPGVQAVIMYRTGAGTPPGSRVRKTGYVHTRDSDGIITIPCLSATFGTGQLLRQTDLDVHLVIDGQVTLEHTYNVFAESRNGDPTRTIVSGSHLDSVAEGPGLNDNGSGTSMNLEMAIQFAATTPNPVNRVRFAWWGAEEIGLLGAYHYVAELEDAGDLGEIACALNFDMVASPNGVQGVHNGTLTPAGTTPETVADSNMITGMFVSHFSSVDRPYASRGMTGGSDFLPFLLQQIPTGGLLTGAGASKTMEERAIWGGFADAPYDPCYHVPCDTVANINQDLLGSNGKAAAEVIARLANTPNLFA